LACYHTINDIYHIVKNNCAKLCTIAKFENLLEPSQGIFWDFVQKIQLKNMEKNYDLKKITTFKLCDPSSCSNVARF
jgi:hypothetical protein